VNTEQMKRNRNVVYRVVFIKRFI